MSRFAKRSIWLLVFIDLMSGLYAVAQKAAKTNSQADIRQDVTSQQRLNEPIPLELPLSIAVLYFDQSSDRLRPNVKVTLDSIAQRLLTKPELLATLTGYTDNLGKHELNMVLAEKRAKAVAQYLQQRGIRLDQLKTTWEGPDPFVPAATAKTISRRVVIQIMPR